jgi:hypothetical protein
MRDSKWTQIYWDSIEGSLRAYVRFVPDFLDTEAAGFSHGISLGNVNFATEKEANEFADSADVFFNKMEESLLEEHNIFKKTTSTGPC